MSKFVFGTLSERNLETLHPAGVEILRGALAMGVMDFGVAETLRSIETQRMYFDTGRSKTMNSYHLKQDDGYAHAFDLYPYPINMHLVNKGSAKEIVRFGVLNGILQTIARSKGITLTWGADWDRDGLTTDHNFFDAMHWQLEL